MVTNIAEIKYMNSIMPKLWENLVTTYSHFRLILEILSDVEEV